MFSEFWPYTRGDRLRLVGGGLFSLVLMGAELGTVIIFEAIVGRVLEQHHLTGSVILITHDPRLTAAADTVLRLASHQPQEQARDWPRVPSPLAEVPARSVLT